MKPKRKSHAETRKANRDQLLAAAREVFATTGYEAATIRDIVRQSGLAQGSYYNYFNTKQDIFEDVIKGIVDPLIPLLVRVRADAQDQKEFFRNAYEACRALPLQNPQVAAIIARNQSAFREIFYLGAGRSQIKSDLAADLAQRHKEGWFLELDFDQMAETQIALGVDLVVQATHSPNEALKRVAFLTDLFQNAMCRSI